METAARYIIGIDLGTTNSSVAYVDTDLKKNPSLAIAPFRIPQYVARGVQEALDSLPSFAFLPTGHGAEVELPLVGLHAREQGAQTPTRLVSSAKSWLCNTAAERREPILPLEAQDPSQRISPVVATAAYLAHIRSAWDASMSKGDVAAEFDQQDIVLTVPASFDEVARTLTVEAAKRAGYRSMTLLEEPQAAFYSWILQHEKTWKTLLKSGDRILVCDVGGGTTDFSLIEVTEKEAGSQAFERMAVGRHLLLGGDNIDAAVAHHLESKLGIELDSSQWHQLRHEARRAKELLLGSAEQETYQAVIHGKGAQVVGGSHSVTVSSKDLQKFLIEGFFAEGTLEESLKHQKSSGMRTMGLPYEDEPSISKHLARFLTDAGNGDAGTVAPDYLLFNGGSMKPSLFQDALKRSLTKWFPVKKIEQLESKSLDLAVSRGAAYFGRARRGLGVRIASGTARTLYLGVEVGGKAKAMTLLPRGSQEGAQFHSDYAFEAQANTPVLFKLYSSHVRLDDTQGQLLDIDIETMAEMPDVQTVLRFGKQNEHKTLPVNVEAILTELGTLELCLQSKLSEHRWQLEFQLRSHNGQENYLEDLASRRSDETFDVSFLEKAKEVISQDYGQRREIKPRDLFKHLEEVLGLERGDWSPSICRGLWDVWLKEALKRDVSPSHEARWWNLAGFLLRPGYGVPLDDHRMKSLWKIFLADQSKVLKDDVLIQKWICFRRLAGGLSRGQQQQIYHELYPYMTQKSGKGRHANNSYFLIEVLRTLASMERLDSKLKTRLGDLLLKRMTTGKHHQSDYWAIGRISARQLIHGVITDVVSRDSCQSWLEKLVLCPKGDEEYAAFAVAQMARKSEHREINLSSDGLAMAEKFLHTLPDSQRWEHFLESDTHLSKQEQELLLGDQLPAGLLLEEV
jgi:hypothetical protein